MAAAAGSGGGGGAGGDDRGPSDDVELMSKQVSVEAKRIFLNLRQNPRGRYLKIAEVSRAGRSTVIIPESGWIAFRDQLNGFISGSHQSSAGIKPAPAPEPREESSSGKQVWVENLPWTTTAEELQAYFKQCGTVEHCEINKERSGRSRGTAVVRFSEEKGAEEAIARLNETDVEGRMIRVRLDRFG